MPSRANSRIKASGRTRSPAAFLLHGFIPFPPVSGWLSLEAFASFNGPAFYGLPRNRGTVTLRREAWTLPEALPFGEAQLKPLRGGETLSWRLE